MRTRLTGLTAERQWELQETVVAKLGDSFPEEEWGEKAVEQVGHILYQARVTFAEFQDLDERPGLWGYSPPSGEWHWRLRRARNQGGKGFFDNLWEG